MLSFISISSTIYAQLAGWITFTDKDNNSYYVAPGGKIYTEERPDFSYKAVSAEGIHYYLSQGKILTSKYNKFEGLLLLKSIRLLSAENSDLYFAGVEASTSINQMSKRLGPRFKEINDAASLLLYRVKSKVTLINDRFDYQLSFNGSIFVTKRKIHSEMSYATDSVFAGLRFDEAKKEGFDALLLINGEYFEHGTIPDVNFYKAMREVKKGGDSLKEKSEYASYARRRFAKASTVTDKELLQQSFDRINIEKNERKLLTEISFVRGGKEYRGYEMLAHTRSKGFVLQLISSEALFAQYKDQMMGIITSFKYN